MRNLKCVSYWLGSFPPAGCLSCNVSAVTYVKMGQNLPTIYDCRLSSYPNNGKGLHPEYLGGKKRKEKAVWSAVELINATVKDFTGGEICNLQQSAVICQSLLFAFPLWQYSYLTSLSPILLGGGGGLNGRRWNSRLYIMVHVLLPPCLLVYQHHSTIQNLIFLSHFD